MNDLQLISNDVSTDEVLQHQMDEKLILNYVNLKGGGYGPAFIWREQRTCQIGWKPR